MNELDSNELADIVKEKNVWIKTLREELSKVLVGQSNLIDRLLVGLLTNSHILLEGVPGIAKTLAVNSLAQTISAHFKRIQFTPDLLPADLLGTLIFNPKTMEFNPKLGPIFANLILADEINRAPAKVQSALLEAMQEKQVTIGETTYKLPNPFLVLATQNPIDQEGTYQLPEAQLDRFLLKVKVDYPTFEEERLIIDKMSNSAQKEDLDHIIDPEVIIDNRSIVDSIYIDNGIKDYIVKIISATRSPQSVDPNLKSMVRSGSSPRGSISLTLACRALAFIEGRSYVIPQDVKDLAHDVLRHRILISYEAQAEEVSSEEIIDAILSSVNVP